MKEQEQTLFVQLERVWKCSRRDFPPSVTRIACAEQERGKELGEKYRRARREAAKKWRERKNGRRKAEEKRGQWEERDGERPFQGRSWLCSVFGVPWGPGLWLGSQVPRQP